MKNHKAIISFVKIKDHELGDLAQNIVTKMTGNTAFPKPVPALTVVQTAIKEYADALTKCQDGNKLDTATKNAKRAVLEKHLAHLGNYVNNIAEGDLILLDSTGIPLTKLPEPIGILPAPTNFRVTDGDNPGEVCVQTDKVEKALTYVVVFATVPAPANIEDWHAKTFSSVKNWIAGLESGKKYIFKVAATSREANNYSSYNFSQRIERFVQ
ncbi:MAG: hypothetical protein WCR55_10675 [Lentisphaerota bacterium]